MQGLRHPPSKAAFAYGDQTAEQLCFVTFYCVIFCYFLLYYISRPVRPSASDFFILPSGFLKLCRWLRPLLEASSFVARLLQASAFVALLLQASTRLAS